MLSKVIFAIGIMLFSTTLFADTPDIIAADRQITAQYVSTNVAYTETGGAWGTLPVVMGTESGSLNGSRIAFSFMANNFGTIHPYFGAQFDSVSGNTTYVGSSIGGTYGSVTGLRAGIGIELGESFMLTPHVEFGSHKWNRGVMLGSGDPAGYRETYTNNWLGVGALGQYSPIEKLVISANILLGNTDNAQISAPYIPGGYSYSGTLGSSSYTRLGLSVDYAIIEHLHINAGYKRTSFRYGASTPNTAGLFEPDSETNYSVLNVGIGYAF